MWRKGDVTVTIPGVAYDLLDLTYDKASRLTDETFKINGGANQWDVDHRFDDV